MADALQYVPGVNYESAGPRFGDEGINIRGIAGNRVVILFDGVPLSDQFAVGSFSNATRDFLDAGLTHRVEILHGPASAIYGSAAIGGVVAARSASAAEIAGESGFGGRARANWRSSDESGLATLQAAWSGDRAGLAAGVSIRQGGELDASATSEIADFRDYERTTALLKGNLSMGDRFEWRALYAHQSSDVESELNSMLGTGRFRSTTALLGDDSFDMDLLSLELGFSDSESWLDSGVARLYWQDSIAKQATLDERGAARTPVSIDRYFEFEQTIKGAEINLHKRLDGRYVSHRIGFGLEFRDKQTREHRDGLSTSLEDGSQTNEILGEVFPLRDFPVSQSRELGAFIEDSIEAGNVTIIAALRADRFELSPTVDAMYAEDYPFADPVSLSESELSPKLCVIFHVSDSLETYLQYAHGFRAPPYEDANVSLEIPFFNYRAIPNPDLQSETSDGVEFGVRWRTESAGIYASAYHTSYEDFIESRVQVGTDPVSGRVLFQSQNIESATIEGIEAGGHLLFGALDNWRIDAAFNWAQGENEDTGEPLNSVGPPQLVVGFGWKHSDGRRDVRLMSTMTSSWSELDESSGELFHPPGYAVFDLYYHERISDRISLRAGILNLTDKEYWQWSDVRGLAPGDPVLPYLSRPGRAATVGVNINW